MFIKKITAAVLSVILLAGCAANTPAATTKKTVSFNYPDGAFEKQEMNASVVYNDAYFTAKPTKRQGGLALLSMGASAAVYNSDDIKAFLKKCSFSDKRYTVLDEKNNNLNFDIGKRKIGKKTVVAVILQGTASLEEWRSNLDLGNSTVHEGFNTTSKAVQSKVNSYIKSNKLKKKTTAFWVTGHSRGAAVADIVAKRLTDKNYQVFAYTFASPKVAKVSAKSAEKYKNIFNYVNPDDIVTSVPTKTPEEMVSVIEQIGVPEREARLAVDFYGYTGGKYRRFGIDITMTPDEHDDMEQTFSDITGADFDAANISHNHCQSCYLSWLMP